MEAWASNYFSFKVVENAWDLNWKDIIESHHLRRSMFNTFKALQKWNREHFGYAHTKIKQLEHDLANLREGEEVRQHHRAKIESILRQKSREIWLKEWDKNSKILPYEFNR